MVPDYRTYLKKAYEERLSRNPRYSLRAFARDLEMSSSQVVEVLSGKQGLSPAKAAKVATKLGWAASDKEKFCALVQARHGRNSLQRKAAEERLRRSHIKKISDDLMSYIADWYHIAILELLALPQKNLDPEKIAKCLDISVDLVTAAIERMQRLGLITMKNSQWLLCTPDAETFDDIPSRAIRKYHEQILERSKDAVKLDVDERELQSLIFSCPRSQLPELKKKIREFCADFDAAKGANPDTVFALNIQLYPLSKESS